MKFPHGISFFGISLVALACSYDALETNERPREVERSLVESIAQPEEQEESGSGDVAALAATYGVSEARVREKLEFERLFDELAVELRGKYPGQISGVWQEPLPEIQGYVRFTGEVPSDLELGAVLSDRVEPIAGGVIPEQDHARHVDLVGDAMVGRGDRNFAIYYDVRLDELAVEYQIAPGSARPDHAGLLQSARGALKAGEANLVVRGLALDRKFDLTLKVWEKEGPLLPASSAYGGAPVRRVNFQDCTSGFSVSGSNGDGLLTAGHCAGVNSVNQIQEPDEGANWSTITKRDSERGNGDSAYYTTPLSEPAYFYFKPGWVRSCTSVWSGGVMPSDGVGQSICSYGRGSNVQKCGSIELSGINSYVSSPWDGTVFTKYMSRASYTGFAGDSGGPVFQSHKAMGIVTAGDPNVKMHFTPAIWAEGVLNVSIKTM